MYLKSLQITLFITLFSIINCFGQTSSPVNESEKWTRIETAARELSAAFPPNYVVDAEKKDYGRIYKITGFSNDVLMEVSVSKSISADSLRYMQPPDEMSSQSFMKKDLKGVRNFNDPSESRLKETFSILGDKNFYFISVTASDRKKPEIARFLYSIKIKGESLFQNPEAQNYPETSVALSSLKTSAEVTEAFERKLEKKKFKVEKNISDDTNEISSYAEYSKPPIIVEQPSPSFRPKFDEMATPRRKYMARLKVTLSADGQVGGITIIAGDDRYYTNACVDSARKLRFIPAQKNGVNADSVTVISCHIQLFKTMPTTVPSGGSIIPKASF